MDRWIDRLRWTFTDVWLQSKQYMYGKSVLDLPQVLRSPSLHDSKATVRVFVAMLFGVLGPTCVCTRVAEETVYPVVHPCPGFCTSCNWTLAAGRGEAFTTSHLAAIQSNNGRGFRDTKAAYNLNLNRFRRYLEHDGWHCRPHVLRVGLGPPRFVKDAYKRVGMKDQALAALTHILVRCTDYRYDVLEVFSVGEVFLALLSFSCS